MGYGLQNSQRMETGLSLRIDPRVIVASQILQLSSSDLESAIESEMSENPALDRTETAEPVEHHEVMSVVAPAELMPWTDSWESVRSLPDEADDTWVDFAVALHSLQDHLTAAIHSRVEPGLHKIADYVVGSLDERGYLTLPDEEIALDCGCSIEAVETVVKALQECEPSGVGARNVLECLQIQLAGSNETDRLARHILRDFLDELTSRRPDRVAKKLKLEFEAVEAAFERIATLAPYPIIGFSRGNQLATRSSSVVADLIIRRTELGWQVEATGVDPAALKINAYYQKQLRDLKKGTDPRESRHLSTFVQRAEDFIDSIRSRKLTLEAIGKQLVETQSGFLSTASYNFLKPLTKGELARRLKVHESTISRATNGKFVQLPDGETVSFEVFFKPALRIQKMIEEILRSENPDSPLSDERIAQMLLERGITVARRTVNKYRDRRKLLSSRKRRAA